MKKSFKPEFSLPELYSDLEEKKRRCNSSTSYESFSTLVDRSLKRGFRHSNSDLQERFVDENRRGDTCFVHDRKKPFLSQSSVNTKSPAISKFPLPNHLDYPFCSYHKKDRMSLLAKFEVKYWLMFYFI